MFTIRTLDDYEYKTMKIIKEEHGISFRSMKGSNRGSKYFVPYSNISFFKEEKEPVKKENKKVLGGIFNEVCNQCI